MVIRLLNPEQILLRSRLTVYTAVCQVPSEIRSICCTAVWNVVRQDEFGWWGHGYSVHRSGNWRGRGEIRTTVMVVGYLAPICMLLLLDIAGSGHDSNRISVISLRCNFSPCIYIQISLIHNWRCESIPDWIYSFDSVVTIEATRTCRFLLMYSSDLTPESGDLRSITNRSMLSV